MDQTCCPVNYISTCFTESGRGNQCNAVQHSSLSTEMKSELETTLLNFGSTVPDQSPFTVPNLIYLGISYRCQTLLVTLTGLLTVYCHPSANSIFCDWKKHFSYDVSLGITGDHGLVLLTVSEKAG